MIGRSYYTFSGRTYPNRDALKRVGASWNSEMKVWTLVGTLLDSTLWGLRRLGVKVEISNTAPAWA